MRINIYGVGRSGTKAIQLYLAWCAAKEHGRVWVNYEPYLWLRRTGSINYEGLRHHGESPIKASNIEEFGKRHQIYLGRLVEHSEPVITKFVRANGRIGAINDAMRVDASIVVVRDLYGVLESMLHHEWNLLDVGSKVVLRGTTDMFPTLIDETRKGAYGDVGKIVAGLIKYAGDVIVRNAIYWFVLNALALENSYNNVYFIKYNALNTLEDIAKIVFATKVVPKFTRDRFDGARIHDQSVIRDVYDPDENDYRINQLRYFVRSKKIKRCIPSLGSEIGTAVEISDNIERASRRDNANLKVAIGRCGMFDELNTDISDRLARRLYKTLS